MTEERRENEVGDSGGPRGPIPIKIIGSTPVAPGTCNGFVIAGLTELTAALLRLVDTLNFQSWERRERERSAIATAVGSPKLGAGDAADVLAEVIKAHVDAVVAAEAEVERLRGEVHDWVCERCRTAYPGPPQPGLRCVICPKCGGSTAPTLVAERREAIKRAERAEAEVERLRSAIATAVGSPKLGAGDAADVLAEVIKAHTDAVVAAEAARDAERARREAAEEVVRETQRMNTALNATFSAWQKRAETAEEKVRTETRHFWRPRAEAAEEALAAYRKKYPEERP